jgi:MinD-like ATPase involved in chromosome partitioning or flagellar assembly
VTDRDDEPSAAEREESAPATQQLPTIPPVDTWHDDPEPDSPPSGATPYFREPDRTGGSFRQPPSRPLPSGRGPNGPPPGMPRDTGPLVPPPINAANAPWVQQPGRQPPRQQHPPFPGGPAPQQMTQPWFPGGYGPDNRMPQPPSGSYAELIRPDDVIRPRRVPPGRGWRLALYKATFGVVNLGQGPEEIRQAQLEAKVRSALRGHFKVGVMGKGGVGKTTVSASIGSVFAELRQDDRVVAIDADTAFGKLGSRVDPRAQGSYWELAGDQHLETFADIRNRVGNNAAGLFVLAGEGTPDRRRVLDPAIYREATSRLDRYFTISIVDCSSTMDTPVTQEVLRDLDALIVVSSPWVDGAAAAGQTLDWLAARGLTALLQRTIVVLNDSDGHADKRTRSILAQQFAGQGQVVVEVPFDGHLRPGGVIDRTGEMSAATRLRFIEIAAALAEHYPTQDDRNRDRR